MSRSLRVARRVSRNHHLFGGVSRRLAEAVSGRCHPRQCKQGAERTAKRFQYASSLFAFLVERGRPERFLDQSGRAGRGYFVGPAANPFDAVLAGMAARVAAGARPVTIPTREQGRNTLHCCRTGSPVRARRAAVALLAAEDCTAGDKEALVSSWYRRRIVGWSGVREFHPET